MHCICPSAVTESGISAGWLRRSTGNPILACAGDAWRVSPIIREAILWIGIQAIKNACARSNAATVSVTLDYRLGRLERCVHDDGIGIDATTLAHGGPGHFGMAGRRERAERVGAQLEIACNGNGGTAATSTLPRRSGANLKYRWWRRVIGPLRRRVSLVVKTALEGP